MADPKYGYSYDCASGPDLNDCCFLGLRYLTKHDVKPEWCESWVMRSVAQIAATTDGKTFATKAKGSMERMRDAKPPLFTEPPPSDDEELEDEEEEEDGASP